VLPEIDTRVPGVVEEEVRAIYLSMYPEGTRRAVSRVFSWAIRFFSGRFADYQAIDARYHDFEHTLQGTLCLARLLRGRQAAKAAPEASAKMFELALLAMLFHDTGYLKRKEDTEGTGAKYTPVHVGRSTVFAREFLGKQGYTEADMAAVQHMISCTGVNADLQGIPFQSELERTLGFALATADLLGQMAADDYVDKLPILYLEFAEAARFTNIKVGRFAEYHSAEELMRQTPAFWETYVWPKINHDFRKLYTFLNDPYPDGPNPYLQRIEKNLTRLRRRLTPDAVQK